MKSTNKIPSLSVIVAITTCCCVVLLAFSPVLQAKSVEPLEGIKFDTSLSLADNLKTLTGKDVTVHLRSGKSVQGYVKTVGNGLVHLEKLAGRDFYDALIRVDDISAMEVKFRNLR